ncbi:MAG: mechanosensitive ion channel family protein, partial [Myxococcales bacterium]|nr:mechanosensitive ion channel family protein [Myxococcales bacterium]
MIERYFNAIEPLISGLIVAGLFIVGIIVARVLTGDKALRERLTTPLTLTLVYLPIAGLTVLARLYLPAAYGLISIVGLFVLSLAVVLAVAAAIFDYFIRGYRVEVPKIVRDIVVIIVYAITIIVALGQHGVNLTGIITTSAVLTAVIGFALQDLLSNLISGLAIQLEQPFRVGDWIQAENFEGRVREVNWRTTKMETRDADIVIVPNNVITRATLVNRSEPSGIHRCTLSIGLRYEEPPNKVKQVLLAAIGDVDGVLKEPAPRVQLKKYDDFSINYMLLFHIDGYEHRERLEDRVHTLVWYRLARAGMSVPFPIRDINVRQVSEKEAAERREAERGRILRALNEVSFLEPLTNEERAHLAS